MILSAFERVENNFGKKENAGGLLAFLSFSQNVCKRHIT